MHLNRELAVFINTLETDQISAERKAVIQVFINYIRQKKSTGQSINLNFICTHNSRRSQFAQIWAKVAADYTGIELQCFSGGTEVTAFNERAVASLLRSGFSIEASGKENPVYAVRYAEDKPALHCFSKLYHDPVNDCRQFAAVMTCSNADENCPFIPGAEARIALLYEDPKAFDGTPQESEKYDERSRQIATEMIYAFSEIKKML